jgi:hypothetical protein
MMEPATSGQKSRSIIVNAVPKTDLSSSYREWETHLEGIEKTKQDITLPIVKMEPDTGGQKSRSMIVDAMPKTGLSSDYGRQESHLEESDATNQPIGTESERE